MNDGVAEAVAFVVVFEAALEAWRKVLRFESTQGHLPIRFTATAPRTNVATRGQPAPWGLGSAGLAVADVH